MATFTINQLVTDPQTNKIGKVIALCNGPHPDRLHLPPAGTPHIAGALKGPKPGAKQKPRAKSKDKDKKDSIGIGPAFQS